ncbi:MAG: nicotinate (nicotinamide) nucleotide adenylyltransferase [Bacteroidota bacterium]
MKIGLFFGSFNPIHVGHLVIANYMATQTDLSQVWLVVTPQNPLKQKKSLAKDYDRLHLVRLAIEGNDQLKASDIEFKLPKPSYTVDTLTFLQEKYPSKEFTLIMGGDNLATLHKWKNYDVLLRDYAIYVYQRPTYALGELQAHPNVHLFDAPQMSISASYIRRCLQDDKSIQYLVPEAVRQYIEQELMYQS